MKGLKAGTTAFDNAWKAEASKNPDKFNAAQHEYAKQTHYDPAASRFEKATGIDPSKAPAAVQDMIWSIGVQHGAGGAFTIFKNSGVKSGTSWEDVLKRVYSERMKVDIYFKSSPQNIKNSVKNRFQRELSDALSMLKR